jgi:hypothetical protein
MIDILVIEEPYIFHFRLFSLSTATQNNHIDGQVEIFPEPEAFPADLSASWCILQ